MPPRDTRAPGGAGAPDAPAPVYNITGDKVALGPGVREQEIADWYASDNDFEITLMAGDPLWPRTREAVEADYERNAKEQSKTFVGFTIYDRSTATSIGGLGLRDIEWTTGCATLGVAIFDKTYWGKGYGTEAICLLLDYAFTVLGLHNILLETYAYNERAIGSYRKVGFQEIGRRREAMRVGQKRYDVVFMDILARDFHSPYPPVVKEP